MEIDSMIEIIKTRLKKERYIEDNLFFELMEKVESRLELTSRLGKFRQFYTPILMEPQWEILIATKVYFTDELQEISFS